MTDAVLDPVVDQAVADADASRERSPIQTDEQPATPDKPKEKPEEPTPLPDDPTKEKSLPLKLRVEQRSQRMRERAQVREAELDRRERTLQQQMAQVQQYEDNHKRLAALYQNDPAKWAAESKLDIDHVLKGKFEENKPEYQVTQLQQEFRRLREELTKRDEDSRKATEQHQAQVDIERSHREFAAVALDAAEFPTIAEVYSDDHEELVDDALTIQNRFSRQYHRMPTHKEIALNLETIHKRRIGKILARRQQDELEAKQAAQTTPANGSKRLQAKKSQDVTSGDVDYDNMSSEEIMALAAKRAKAARRKWEETQG